MWVFHCFYPPHTAHTHTDLSQQRKKIREEKKVKWIVFIYYSFSYFPKHTPRQNDKAANGKIAIHSHTHTHTM